MGTVIFAGRSAGLVKDPPIGPSFLTASSGLFGSWATGSRKAVSTASLIDGLLAVSEASNGGDRVGAGDRVGVGVSFSDGFAPGSSSLGSQTGIAGSVTLRMLEPVTEYIPV
jgi:hypothetical protein